MKTSPETVNDKHLHEWQASKVSQEIINNSVLSLDGDEAFERICYALEDRERTNTGRLRDKWLKRYDHLYHGGWWCNGIDLVTLQESEWGCFKPEKPRVENGKHLKYEHPPHTSTKVFALGTADYWKGVIEGNQTILITEGAKKAGCLLSQNFPAVGLSGICNFLDEDALKPDIKALCKPGREFCIAFDQDKRWEVRDNVSRAIRKLSHYLQLEGCIVTVLVWDYEHGKGIDDFVAKKGEGELQEIFDSRLTFEEYWEKYAKPHKMDFPKFYKFLRTELKGRIAWNQLLSRVEFDGTPLEMSGKIRYKFLEEYNMEASEKTIIDGLMYEADKNSYHPVREYLDGIAGLEPVPLDNLATRYLGTKDPFYDILLKKWLIAAVSRIYEPGCKFDNALILQGDAYAGKSEFLRTLGGKWFDDSFGSNVESAKSLQVLHKCWIQEWSEFDKVTSKQDFNTLKGFLSRQSDCFVRQYGRDALDNPRMSVMAGSINPLEFLKDETGDRRFWVIPLPKGWIVPVDCLRKERDGIWAAAVQAYKVGESRFLSREEYELHKQANEQFRDKDAWFDTIENYLSEKLLSRFSIDRILIDGLGLTIDKVDTKSRNRVRAVLVGMGCQPLGVRVETEYDNRKRRVWQMPGVANDGTEFQEKTTVSNGQQHSGNGKTTVVTTEPLPTQMVTVQDFQESGNGSNTKRAAKLLFNQDGKKTYLQKLEEDKEKEEYDSELLMEICSKADSVGRSANSKLEDFLKDRFGEGAMLEKLNRSQLMDVWLYLDELVDQINAKTS